MGQRFRRWTAFPPCGRCPCHFGLRSSPPHYAVDRRRQSKAGFPPAASTPTAIAGYPFPRTAFRQKRHSLRWLFRGPGSFKRKFGRSVISVDGNSARGHPFQAELTGCHIRVNRVPPGSHCAMHTQHQRDRRGLCPRIAIASPRHRPSQVTVAIHASCVLAKQRSCRAAQPEVMQCLHHGQAFSLTRVISCRADQGH